MIDQLRIRNFRCLREIDWVPMCPLTVLIGPNDSGKSAFLTALRAVARITNVVQADYWRHVEAPLIQASIGTRRYGLGEAIPELAPAGFYHLPSQGVLMQSGGTAEREGVPSLTSEGANLPAVLDSILRHDRRRFDQIVAAFKNRVPGLEDIRIPTPDAGSRRIELVIERGFTIEGNAASTGVRTILFFITLAHLPEPPKLILIEEPETGVHPKRLADIVSLLRDITTGKHGKHPAQVVLSTHSPYLLDEIDLTGDQVLVFRRLEDGSRTAEPVDQQRLKTFLDEFMLGEVWFNRGEQGLVRTEG